MRSTVIAPNSWAAAAWRFENAKIGRLGCRVMTIEHAVARLAGGFGRSIDRISVLDILKDIIEESCPKHFKEARKFPGLARAIAASLMKTWSANLDLASLADRAPQVAALLEIEKAVLEKLPKGMRRHGDLKEAALNRMTHAPAVLGDVTIVGRTEMSPVWRDFTAELAKVVKVTWEAGPRLVPSWLDPLIAVARSSEAGVKPRYLSCADAAHEVLEALRWARNLVALEKVAPGEIAIVAAAPAAYDGFVSALVSASVLPVHFIHGRPAAESRSGQEASALADVFLNGVSLQGFRRLAGLSHGPAFRELPDGWMRVLPRDASLTKVDRWKAWAADVDAWPGGVSFADRLLAIIEALSDDKGDVAILGMRMLGGRARAIWERALLEGPAAALLTSIATLSTIDDTDGLSAVAFGSAAAIASSPRPYVWLLGLNAGSWPRRISEDALLPAHLIDQALLDPLPVIDADRRDFETILRACCGEVMVSRARRDVEGRELGLSSLWPIDVPAEELTKSAPAASPFSEGDRLAARIPEFNDSAAGGSALGTWRDWHRLDVTAHDGKVRPNHPMVLAALERPMSASTISLLLTNPLGWLLREVVGLVEPDLDSEPLELLPPEFGNLVHAIIERSIIISNAAGSNPDLAAAIVAAAEEVAKRFEIEAAVPPVRLWRATIERAKVMAGMALAPSFLPALKGQKSWAEVPFGREDENPVEGMPWDTSKPVVIAGVRVRGKVDRLDVAEDGKAGRVIDWKTGKLPDDASDWIINGGAEVQRPIYASAAKQLAGISELEAGLAYLRGSAIFVPLQDVAATLELVERRLATMRKAAKAGLLLPGPKAGSRFSDTSFALPGDAKQRYLAEKELAVIDALGAAAAVWEDA